MKRVLLNLILLSFWGIAQSQSSVLNPADVNVTFAPTPFNAPTNLTTPVTTGASGAYPGIPPYGSFGIWKWVRTPRANITWNTSAYKCYIVGNVPFRLRFPNSYVPGANDGKKYPIVVFWHGGGEANGTVAKPASGGNNAVYDGRYDNEYQLYQGAQNFGLKATNDEEAFVIFPQTQYVGWDDYYYSRMNTVIDEIIANCKGDENRVISMGLSMGGFAALQYATLYPKRVAAVISSSGIQVNNLVPPAAPVSTVNSILQIPVWFGNGGTDTNPDSVTVSLFANGFTGAGGNLQRSYLPLQGHVMWDYQWAEEPNFDSIWGWANKANPVVYFNNRFFCPGAPVSATMGVTAGFFQYEWDKDGVTIGGATGNTYTANALGTYRCRFKRTNVSDWSAWSPVPAQLVAVCPPVIGTGTGLTGNYYNSNDVTTNFKGTRTDASLNFYIENTTSPFSSAGVSGSTFSVRWTGKVQAQFTETYTFYTKNDDGLRLWINGALVIDNWATHSGIIENTAKVSMVAGQQYDIKIEYYNINNFQNNSIYNSPLNYNTGIMSLKWSSPSTIKQMVPKSQLYLAGTGLPTAVPLCTTNLTPANAAVIPSATTTTLTWTPVSSAGSYDLYFGAGTATPTVVTASNLTTTSYTATVVPGTVYTWYVIPKNNIGSAAGCGTSNKTTFTVSAPIPACVTNSSPANAAVIATPSSATLTWGAAVNATSYDVYLWTGATPPAVATANVATPTYSPSNLLPNTTYSWYIAPSNASGTATGCAATKTTTFTTAILPVPACVTNTSPVNGTTIATETTANLTWPVASTATSYDVYIWEGLTPPALPTANTSTNSYNVSGLTGSTLYNWYVAPRNTTGANTTCASTKTTVFTTAAPIIPVPVCTANTSPADASTIATQSTATLSWGTVANATSYDVYVWTGATPPASATANVTTNSYTATELTASTLYNWYVVPKNATGPATGCISNKTTFTTAAIPVPLCATNTAPVDGATVADQTTATLSWGAIADATSYDVYVWTGATPPAVATANVTTATYTATGLTAGTTYNWYVTPKNTSGPAIGCGTTNKTTFITAAVPVPPCATNTAPVNGSTIATQTTATLTWGAVGTATSYDVFIWSGATPPAVATANVTSASFGATNLTPSALYNWYVVPKNAGGSALDCGATKTTTFTTAAVVIPVPDCATNSAPVNGSTIGTQTTATLNWGTVADATSYDVYLWTGVTVPTTPVATVTTPAYDATGLTAAALYNWYVVPKNASGLAANCNVSNKSTFTTAAIPAPSCVINTAPADNASLTTQSTATLTWGAAGTATSYDVYLWTGATVPTTPVANVAVATYSATGLTANSLYHWYVVPKNAGGDAAGCSTNTTTFTTASPIPGCITTFSPLGGATVPSENTAILSWNAVANATSYDVFVWPVSSGSSPSTPTGTVSSPTFTATGLSPNINYIWYVLPKNASGSAAGCDANTFFTASLAAPACTDNLLPANGSSNNVNNNVTFTWTPAPGATSYDLYIWWEHAAEPTTASVSGIAGTSYNGLTLNPAFTYKWYIVPKNTNGMAVGCGATKTTTFTTLPLGVPVPSCVTNSSPANNASITGTTTATLTWNTAANATTYELYLWSGNTPPTTATQWIQGNSNTTYNASGLTPGLQYHWYVVPRSDGGAPTGCAANATTFTTAAFPVPDCATNTSPANNATIVTQNNGVLVWSTVPDATSYDVYVWTGATVPTTPTGTVTDNSYLATGLIANTPYSWYVVPKNTTGPAVGCGATNKSTFTTAAIPVPDCATNVSPANAAIIATQTTVNLDWTDAPNATSYDVYIWTGATPPTTATANVSISEYDATGLVANTAYNWYVVPKSATGAATGCAANKTTFTTAAIPVPLCAVNTAPVNGTTIATQNTAALSWSSVANATSYDVYVWTGATPPASPTANVGTNGYTAINLTGSTLYNWYVIPKNASGAATGCDLSNRSTFNTAAVPVPVCATNTAPANGSTIATQTSATLTWSPVAAATSYDVYIWTGATPPASATANVTAATYSAINLTPSSLYNWYVVPKNAGGPAIGCGATNSSTFTTAAVVIPVPGCATNSAPLNGATIATQNTAALSWSTIANATSYDVYVWTGATPPASPVANVTAASYSATGLIAGTTYSWYVLPRNAGGSAVGCAATSTTTFITAALPVPICATNASPLNGATVAASNTASLSWSAVATATSYDVYVWTGATPPASPTANVGTNSYIATGLTGSTLYNWYVTPKNASGPAVGCAGSNATTFTTLTVAPACASSTLPANGAVITTYNQAELSWGAVQSATSYDVYIWPTSGSAPATPSTNVNFIPFLVTNLTGSTSYSWYVVPRNSAGPAVGCAASGTSTFTTAATPLPGCSILTVPANGSTVSGQTTASIGWTVVTDATLYDLYLWTGPTAPTVPTVSNLTFPSYSATGLLPGTTYTWYAIPKNSAGSAVGCDNNKSTFTTASAIVLPACVINTLPANAAVLPSQTSARLNWPASAGATSYDVYLAAGNAVPTVLRTNTTDLTYYATGLTAGTLYSWYIAPRNANGANTACGSTNRTTFTTATATGGANQGPVANGGANVTITLPVTTATLNGTASYDPDGSIAEYYWYQTQGPVTASIGNFTGTPVITGLTTAGTYVFGLQVKDNSGTPSWSQVTVIVNPVGTPTVPACVTNTSPAAGTTLATQTTATLTWPASSGATSYDVYLAAGTGTPTTLVTNTAALTYSATGLTAGTVYTWYIAPRNAVGAATTCAASNATSFTTAAVVTVPACVTNTSPVAGTTLATQTSVTLTWPSAAGATSYDVYLAAGAGTPTVLVTNTSALTYTTTLLNASTTYSWYIAPRNAGGVNTTCAASNTTTFTTAAPTVPLAACVINTSPVAGTTLATQTTATLTWPASANATSYDVYLAAGAGTPTVLVTNTAALTYSATGLTAATTYSWYIAPRNASGANTACGASNTTTFITATPPVPACVTNTAPAAGTTIATQNTATLTWPSSATATSYDVYLSAGAGTPATLVTNTAALTYNATGLAANTLYSWYIAPRNAGGVNTACAASNTTSFTTAAAPVLSACVINTLPANAAVLPSQTSARLNWPASAGATSYDVYLAAGNAVPTVLRTNTTDLTYYATGLTAGTLYSWYIAPRNANGANTACGSTNRTTFTTATATGGANQGPVANGGANVTITLPVTTATLNGTASYDPDGSIAEYYWYQTQGPVTASIGNFTGTPVITGLTTAGTYVFGLQVKDNSGTPSWSQATVIVNPVGTPTVPACVTNTSPAAGTTLATQTTATLTWPASSGATSYDVYLAAGTGTPTTLVTNTAALTYSATGLTAGTVYTWYIAPRNAVGAATTCAASNATSFTTAAVVTVPACVTNTSPVAGTTLATQTSVTLTWPSAAGATSYDVYLAAGAGTPTVLVTNTSALTYTTTLLNASTTYSWYIAPRNAGGVNTTCAASNTTTFTTAAPTVPLAACVINTSPVAGTTLATQTTATLTWPASANATSYDVYLAAGAGTPTVLVTNTAALTYSATGLTAATTYSWYIAPRNASGANTACGASNTTTFITATPPVPACVTNTAPAAGTTIATQNTATLTWPSSATATSYDVYLSAGAGTPATLVTNTAALTYNATGLAANTLYSWYIAPRNAGGVNTACAASNTTSFTTAAAPVLSACVINTLPANAAVLPSQTSARLNWPASAGATSYDVYLAAGNAVPTVLRTNTTDLTYYATGLTAGTLYSWYIAPRNANGANTACGSTNRTTFTTATATGGANQGPVANGGANVTITLPVTTATLNGTASYDPDGSIAEYYWYQTQGPVTASIGNFTGTPVITGLTTAGTYIFGLQVKDNSGTPSWSQVTVTVRAAGAPLVADAGNNLRVAATTDAVSASVVSAVPSLSSTVSPNPVKPGQYARVQISSDKVATAAITIVNSNGFIVTSQKVNLVAGMNTTNISTSSLGQGFYIISITGGSKPINMKLLVE